MVLSQNGRLLHTTLTRLCQFLFPIAVSENHQEVTLFTDEKEERKVFFFLGVKLLG